MLDHTVRVTPGEAAVASLSHPHLYYPLMVTAQPDDHHREEVVLHVGALSEPQLVNGVAKAELTYLLILCHLTCLAVQEPYSLTVASKDIELLALAHHHVIPYEVHVPIRSLVIIPERDILIFPATDAYLPGRDVVIPAIDIISVRLVVSGYLCLHGFHGVAYAAWHDGINLIFPL